MSQKHGGLTEIDPESCCLAQPPEMRKCETDRTIKSVDDKPIMIAEALRRAAVQIVEQCGGCVDRTDLQWSRTRSFPTCCNHVAAAPMTPGLLNRPGGDCLNWQEWQWQVLISQCQPHVEILQAATEKKPAKFKLPDSGVWEDCNPDTLTGHAIFMTRLITNVQKGLLDVMCCHLPEECIPCESLYISEITSSSEDFCAQVRLQIRSSLTS